jgi:hypothetical protein
MSTDDERLLAELHEALRSAEQVPARFAEAGKAAFAWRHVDAELATLRHDSNANESEAAVPSGTRADRAELRALTFVSSELTIELELTMDALVGQVIPARRGDIELEGPNGRSGRVTVDEMGWFAIRPIPSGPVRLHLRADDGRSTHTEWITL